MSFDADEEILQDFLVEAGEILESLSEQLVDLEQRPDDANLLNAIFRGFHTVKGGAGFLQLTPLVECCHIAENVFDILRNGQRQVDSDLMDTVLEALDAVNEMFDAVRSGVMPENADPELLKRLHHFASPAGTEPEVCAEQEEPISHVVEQASEEYAFERMAEDEEVQQAATHDHGDDITEEEFDALLDQLQGSGSLSTEQPDSQAVSAEQDSEDDEITDEEFEALLDQLHGQGEGPSQTSSETASSPSDNVSDQTSSLSAFTEGDDEITDSEFEALLDQLHGPGQFKAAANPPKQASEQASKGIQETDTQTVAGKQPDVEASKPVKASDVGSQATTATTSKDDKVEAAINPAVTSSSLPGASANSGTTGNALKKAQPLPAASRAPLSDKKPLDKPDEKAAVAETTVRVDTKRLDDIMNMVGELVLVRNRLVRLGGERADESLNKAVANLDVVTTDLQNSVMKTRMQPIKKVFGRFPRVVRDLARMLKKEVNLELVGEDTDLDKNLVEALADPLVHLVRNSVDHGVEMPDVREAKGKPRTGKVLLSAEQEGDHILLRITDDGAGMDPNKLRAIAVTRGLYDQEAADRLSDKDCYALIFAPGFSTKTEISDVSGRGVGMDVVKTRISQLNGSVDIDSELGSGTRISIKVPLTLAIMPTLMVMVDQQAFALPLVNVDEIFNLQMKNTNIVDGRRVVLVRGRTLPLFNLGHWLLPSMKQRDIRDNDQVVVVSIGSQKVGFVVDALIGQEEVVIKPLGKMLQGTEGMAGATITGDGSIALILDVPSLLKRYA